jgi:hypothetical protein
MKPGRNEPCPCGSGKKYKHCCLIAAEAHAHSPDQMVWRRVRRELEGFPQRMLRFVVDHYGVEAIDEAWWEFNLWPDDEEPFDPQTPQTSLFMPWLFHRWSPNPDDTEVANTALHGVTPTQTYLAQQRRKLSPLMCEYLQSCVAHTFSFFEVTRCEPGQGFTLCDLLTGHLHEVLERSASQAVRVHDVIFGQLAVAQGVTLLEATSPVALPPDDKLAIFELAGRVRENADDAGIDYADVDLSIWDIELRELYLDLSERRLYPEIPYLQNSDGDDMEFHKLVFDIDSAQRALELLRHADARALGLCQLDEAAEGNADGELKRVRIEWLKTGDAAAAEARTVLGTLWIEGDKLTAEVNSRERANALRHIISDTLGTCARFRLDSVQSIEQALASSNLDEVSENIGADDPEIQALLTAHLREHYRTWIDTALPALDGRTPRQAANDSDGRNKVEALVQQIERGNQQIHPAADASIARMLRRELGLEATGPLSAQG